MVGVLIAPFARHPQNKKDQDMYSPAIDASSMPDRIRALPVSEKFKMPVPWFVAWVDGKPEFRAADQRKLVDAIRFKKCWVCGESLGRNMTFVIGPMCGINRTSAEPPSHLECAQWSARNCPFLANAGRRRREDDQINNENFQANAPGFAITRNPGVTLLWTTRDYQTFSDGRGGALIHIGNPLSIEVFAGGRHATRAEIDASIAGGIPALEQMAKAEGDRAFAELTRMRSEFEALLPV